MFDHFDINLTFSYIFDLCHEQMDLMLRSVSLLVILHSCALFWMCELQMLLLHEVLPIKN